MAVGKTELPLDDGAGQWPVGVGRGAHAPGFSGSHDVGGVEALLGGPPLDTADRQYSHWERQTHALLTLLVGQRQLRVDELRRAIEAMHPVHVARWGYYDKWATAMATLALERNLVTGAELDAALGVSAGPLREPRWRTGDAVRVCEESLVSRWRKPHLRTPGYLFGATGTVERHVGAFGDPEFLAFRGAATEQHLYRVRFQQAELWPEHVGAVDTVDVEVYESWLEPASPAASPAAKRQRLPAPEHSDGRGHSHGQDGDAHVHSRAETEQNAVEREGPETPGQRILEGLVKALTSRGVITADGLRRAIEAVDAAGTQSAGPRLVARAWLDADFRARLLKDATAAAAELGIAASNTTTKTALVCVESTAEVHNLVVCTLCSCYPLSLLGLSPPWYKSRAYRARAVREPRRLLRESFGLSVPDSVAIRVHDSTADCRYLVIPRRPPGTEGWSEARLQALVTRDTMIGVAVCEATAA